MHKLDIAIVCALAVSTGMFIAVIMQFKHGIVDVVRDNESACVLKECADEYNVPDYGIRVLTEPVNGSYGVYTDNLQPAEVDSWLLINNNRSL